MENMVHFDKVNISDTHYDVLIQACSPGGCTFDEADVNIKEVHSSFFCTQSV